MCAAKEMRKSFTIIKNLNDAHTADYILPTPPDNDPPDLDSSAGL